MATFTVILDNSPLGGTNSNGNNAFVDAQGNGTNDIINVYITPSYNGDIANFADIWADPGDTINFFVDPAYRPIGDVSSTNERATIAGSPTHYVDYNGGPSDVNGGEFTGTLTFQVGAAPNFVVEGTSSDDIIDDSYIGDPDGDKVDALDALDGSNDDLIEAYGGNDLVSAGAGEDEVYGGSGTDTIDGGSGDDTLDAGVDNDVVYGGSGNDSILGGDGDDILRGDEGDPSLAVSDGTFDADYGNSYPVHLMPNGPEGIFNGNGGSIDYQNSEQVASGSFGIVDQDDEGGVIRMLSIGNNQEMMGMELDAPLLAGETYAITFDGAVLWAPNSNVYATDGAFEFFGSTVVNEVGSGANGIPANATALGTVNLDANDPNGDGDSRTLDTYTFTFTPTQDIETLYVRGEYSDGSRVEYSFIDNITIVDVNAAPIVAGDDTIDGGLGDDIIHGDGGNDTLTGGGGSNTSAGGAGDDTFIYSAAETLNITDFGAGATNANDGNNSNNDYVDLSSYYTNQAEFEADMADDGIANQSVGDFSDNTSMLGGQITGLDSLVGISDTSLKEQTGIPICFTRGTSILTPNGDVCVEDLRVGSRVETLDHGPQTVRWIGSTVRAATGACAPVRIRAGSLDNDRDLWVSQQHRMVLRGAKAELMFGDHEVLVPAKSLVNDCSVRIIEGGEVEYFHILFDNHEIIYAEGAMAESLHLGKQSFDALSHASIQEIKMLFPELEITRDSLPATARPVLRNYEVQALLHTT